MTATPYTNTAGNVSGAVPAGQLSGTLTPANVGVGSITSTMLATGGVTTAQPATGAVTTEKLNTLTTFPLAITLTNPTPVANEHFGNALSTVGTAKALIGADADAGSRQRHYGPIESRRGFADRREKFPR